MEATFEHKSISGIGDYLNALNHALHLCDLLGLDYFHTSSKLSVRTGHSSIDSFLGLDNLPMLPRNADRLEELTMHQGYTLVSQGLSCFANYLGSEQIKIVFSPSDYQHGSFFSEVRRNHKRFGYHPSLTSALKNSQMYSRYRQHEARLHPSAAKRILLHVRRGDVALTPLRQIAQEYSIDELKDAYYYPITGEILHGLPSDFSRLHQSHRIITNDAYLRALQEAISNVAPFVVVLVSDGYTQASKHLAKIVASKLGLQSVSHDDIENILNHNLDPLNKEASLSIIGETPSNLELSLIEFLVADYVIHGPSCFPMTIRRMAGVEDPVLKSLSQA